MGHNRKQEQKEWRQYSRAFKQKVINEIECGKFTINQAKKIYDIGGGSTIHKWIKQMGKNQLLSKVVRIEMTDEISRMKELEKRIKELEKALVNKELELLKSESYFEVICEDFGINDPEEYKKKLVKDLLKRQSDQK